MTASTATLWQTMRAVFWAFFGVRKRAHLESDVANLKLSHVVIAGITGAIIFVFILLLVVRWVTSV